MNIVSLHHAEPRKGEDQLTHETSYAGYTRQTFKEGEPVVFPPNKGRNPVTITHIGLGDGLSLSDVIPLDPPTVIATNQHPAIDIPVRVSTDAAAVNVYIIKDLQATIDRLLNGRRDLTPDAQAAIFELARKPVQALTPLECLWLMTLIEERNRTGLRLTIANLFHQCAKALMGQS